MIDDRPDQDGLDGGIDARVFAPLYSSADRRFRKGEDVVLDSFACSYVDHLVTRRDERVITAVELAVLHHELAVDPLRWFSDVVAVKKHWHSLSDAVFQQFAGADPDLVHRWNVRPIEFGMLRKHFKSRISGRTLSWTVVVEFWWFRRRRRRHRG